jgi:hypothetical protein
MIKLKNGVTLVSEVNMEDTEVYLSFPLKISNTAEGLRFETWLLGSEDHMCKIARSDVMTIYTPTDDIFEKYINIFLQVAYGGGYEEEDDDFDDETYLDRFSF